MKNTWFILAVLAFFSCAQPQPEQPVLIDKDNFETQHDGKQVDLYTLKNSNGLVAQITNYGGKVVNLWTPDKNGNFGDIVLGFETIDEYFNTSEIYFGSLIGRYGNRIGSGTFSIDGTVYSLEQNNNGNALHGGIKGFNNVVWDASQLDEQTLELNYLSKDMEEGYPGNLNVKVVYKLTNENELKIEYWATTDRATPVNLTHHSFFNLKGAGNGDINEHIVQINADSYTPVDDGLIPTGEIAPVEGTPMDFRKPTAISERVRDDFEQLKFGNGYDHNWVLNQADNGLTFAAKVLEPNSGRTMEVYTNEPGIQFYGGNFLDGTVTGKEGKIYEFRSALCLETQHFPDSPNKPDFPSTVLKPGDEYYSICVYKFGIEQ
ncbi:aldose epimerase family protein [Maribellus maritimus]|uniref:aldose epimerase family protein n=1 Tax=Maribellus maritimus TaxID=2870838 RepID=UPI001EEBC076|nr:aldose epimerase family protein [Maribellus maritimus]MCG6187524.1 galactose mutarotase [Maribellus maritimus]